MVIAALSDVHSNLDALQAVLKDLQQRGGADAILFVGDAVGYGPQPNECVSMLANACNLMIAGNHDWAALGMFNPRGIFNPVAAQAALWTSDVLTKQSRSILAPLPLEAVYEPMNLILAHGSPLEPERWHYLLTESDLLDSFGFFTQRICLIGHSHVPLAAELKPNGDLILNDSLGSPFKLNPDSRYIINVGSIGQPRDKDPRAAYLLMNKSEARLVRVPYDFKSTQKKILDASLPPRLAERLAIGR